MAYNFDKQMTVGKYLVEVDSKAMYGYFEHQEYGSGGGLWFEEIEDVLGDKQLFLRDYDGTFALPKQASAALIMLGFYVGVEFQ